MKKIDMVKLREEAVIVPGRKTEVLRLQLKYPSCEGWVNELVLLTGASRRLIED